MKALPAILFSLTLGLSLSRAADGPKGAGGGQNREVVKEMLLQKFDSNKNGTLEPEEKAAAMKTMQERRGSSKGGPGKGPVQEMILQKFDANKNGVLDPEEKAAAVKAMQERKGKSGGFPGAGSNTNAEGGSKFRRPPEAPKEK